MNMTEDQLFKTIQEFLDSNGLVLADVVDVGFGDSTTDDWKLARFIKARDENLTRNCVETGA